MESHGLLMLGDLDLSHNVIKNVVFDQLDELPTHENSKAGSFAFVKRRVMVCVEIAEGIPFWVPLTQEMDMYIHIQEEVSDTWTIIHSMNTATVFQQCYDENGILMWPDEVDCSVEDVVTLRFNMPVKGKSIIFYGRTEGLAKPDAVFERSFASSTIWVVNHQLGYEPDIRCTVGNYEVKPKTITHVSTTEARVTWDAPTSGSVICL